MSSPHKTDFVSMIVGVVTSVGVGTFVLHALSAFVLAMIGAMGGWVFGNYIKPKLDAWLKRKKDKKSRGKA